MRWLAFALALGIACTTSPPETVPRTVTKTVALDDPIPNACVVALTALNEMLFYYFEEWDISAARNDAFDGPLGSDERRSARRTLFETGLDAEARLRQSRTDIETCWDYILDS